MIDRCASLSIQRGRAGTGPARLHGLEGILQPRAGVRPSATASAPLGATMGGSMVDPLYVQASLVAQAWPVQALLESLRRSYGPV
jgi:hypothetical protein